MFEQSDLKVGQQLQVKSKSGQDEVQESTLLPVA